MARLGYSAPAKEDLKNIGLYTWEVWGVRQTNIYLDKLDEACRRIHQFQMIGRPCEHLREGLRRLECGKHTIFYVPSQTHTVIVRILHQDMLPSRRDFLDPRDNA